MHAGSVEPGRAGKRAETATRAAFSRLLMRWDLVESCREVRPLDLQKHLCQASQKRAHRGCGLSNTGTGVGLAENGGPEACREAQAAQVVRCTLRGCPDRWFRLTGVDAYGKSCQAV